MVAKPGKTDGTKPQQSNNAERHQILGMIFWNGDVDGVQQEVLEDHELDPGEQLEQRTEPNVLVVHFAHHGARVSGAVEAGLDEELELVHEREISVDAWNELEALGKDIVVQDNDSAAIQLAEHDAGLGVVRQLEQHRQAALNIPFRVVDDGDGECTIQLSRLQHDSP